MRKAAVIISIFIAALTFWACEDSPVEAGFEDMIDLTIYDYLLENKDNFSSFLSILEKGGLDKTLSAYNPNGTDYTLFLPDNKAVDEFIKASGKYNSLNDLLNDNEYVSALARYHVVNMGIPTNDFPFGAFSQPTLSYDYLTVSFIIEPDTSYYKINNQSAVIKPNIEVSNGYIHIVQNTLNPITYTTYQWLSQHPEYSIFKAAVDLTGLDDTLNINKKIDPNKSRPFTLLVEPDAVYKARNINSAADLAAWISPGNSNYTNTNNPLYNFVAYHVLDESRFIDDFESRATNYATYSDIPLNINGLGIDIMINKGKEIFEYIIHGQDTTVIDFIGIDYDASNVITQSGSIHMIDRVMRQYQPSRAITTYEFWEEAVFNEYRKEPATYPIENQEMLTNIKWTGPELTFVKSDDEAEPAWGDDYIEITGDFTITYTIPKIVQGKYNVFLGADSFNAANALVEVTIDGKKIGGLVDLTQGGSSSNPIPMRKLGTIDFVKFDMHTVVVKTLIPGRFKWDYIRFEPF